MGGCVVSALVNALDDDAQHSRSDSSDLNMVKIEVKILLYDHVSRFNSSCCKEDDLEGLTFILRC